MQFDHPDRQRLYSFASRDDVLLSDAEAAHVFRCETCRQLVRAVFSQRLNPPVPKVSKTCAFNGQRKIRRAIPYHN
jgi:hypothetical protein